MRELRRVFLFKFTQTKRFQSTIPLLAGHEDVGHLRGCPASSWPAFLGRG